MSDGYLSEPAAPPPLVPPPPPESAAIADLARADTAAPATEPPAKPSLMDLAGDALGRALQPPDPEVTGQFVDLKQRELGAYSGQQARNERVFQEDRARNIQAFNAEQATINSTPKWDAEAERKKYQTNPLESFGSFASVFAMIASSFTRDPMTNALNASAAAMQAKRDNNEFEYNHAYQAWKDNTDLAVKRFNMQHAAMGDAFKIMETDTARGNAKLVETMTKFGMERELLMYQNGMIPELQQQQTALANAARGVMQAQAEIMRAKDQQARTADMQERTKIAAQRAAFSSEDAKTTEALTDKYLQEQQAQGLEPDIAAARLKATEEVAKAKAAGKSGGGGVVTESREQALENKRRYEYDTTHDTIDPEEAKRRRIFDSTHVRQGSPLSEYQKTRIQAQTAKIESVTNQIERTMQLIEQAGKTGESLTGAVGAYGTIKEALWGGSTNHAEFTQLIRTIQQEALPIIKGTTRLSADERKTVDVIVPGLGFLRNTEQVYDGLDKLLKILRKKDLLDKPEIGGGGLDDLKPGDRVRQNGVSYEMQPDRSMKAVQ